VHGSGGNFASLQLRATARALSARGFAALSISTRQHDKHVNTDNFFEVRRDIEAAVATFGDWDRGIDLGCGDRHHHGVAILKSAAFSASSRSDGGGRSRRKLTGLMSHQ
jgi:hypothetical protein